MCVHIYMFYILSSKRGFEMEITKVKGYSQLSQVIVVIFNMTVSRSKPKRIEGSLAGKK